MKIANFEWPSVNTIGKHVKWLSTHANGHTRNPNENWSMSDIAHTISAPFVVVFNENNIIISNIFGQEFRLFSSKFASTTSIYAHQFFGYHCLILASQIDCSIYSTIFGAAQIQFSYKLSNGKNFFPIQLCSHCHSPSLFLISFRYTNV